MCNMLYSFLQMYCTYVLIHITKFGAAVYPTACSAVYIVHDKNQNFNPSPTRPPPPTFLVSIVKWDCELGEILVSKISFVFTQGCRIAFCWILFLRVQFLYM
jgi:hypothetical protein